MEVLDFGEIFRDAERIPANKTNYITMYSNSAESNINFRNDIASKNIRKII